ncbi:MAG: YdgA family protein [Gammaproteobacteria bacterium]|nr:YdgA family protein [Gammaproteobacteria bacterium]
MFKRIGIALAVIVVIIVAAAAIAPYFVGGAAETGFRHQVAWLNSQLADRGLSLHVVSYDRGFYGSDADIALSVSPGGMSERKAKMWAILFGSSGKPVFHLHINHGPIPFDAFGRGHWNFMPVLYTAGFQGKSLPAASLLGALKPGLYVIQYFDGSTHSRLTVPPGRARRGVGDAKWQGGFLVADVNAARDQAHYAGVIEPVTFQMVKPESRHAYGGKFQGLNFSAALRKAAHGFWVGTGHYAFAGLTVSKDGAQSVKLASGRARGETSETGNGKWLNSSARGELDGGVIRGWEFSELTVGYKLEKLDARGLRLALDAIRQRADSASTQGQAAKAQLGRSLPLLALAVKPETTASLGLRLVAPSGSASLAIRAGFAPSAGARTGAGSGLLRNAVVQIALRFDRELVDDFHTQVLGAPDSASFNQAIQVQVDRGYLQEKGGSYRAVIRYEGGMVTINGKPMLGPAGAGSGQAAPVPASG